MYKPLLISVDELLNQSLFLAFSTDSVTSMVALSPIKILPQWIDPLTNCTFPLFKYTAELSEVEIVPVFQLPLPSKYKLPFKVEIPKSTCVFAFDETSCITPKN